MTNAAVAFPRVDNRSASKINGLRFAKCVKIWREFPRNPYARNTSAFLGRTQIWNTVLSHPGQYAF
jgi:GH43 family beta-xylosidase